jgi:biotin operon repressor
MINCQSLHFDSLLQQQRLNKAFPLFGEKVVCRLLCFSLYLLGVNRRIVSEVLSLPPGSLRTVVRAIQTQGLPALEDKRHRTSSFLPKGVPMSPSPKFFINRTDQGISITNGQTEINLSQDNPLQIRVVLLTLLNDGLIGKQNVAETLNISLQQVWNLGRSLQSHDVGALIDKRQGQQHDYRITPEIKSELIQQFTADVITRGQTSGKALSKELKERCNLSISERTVRHHVANMGLPGIKKSLPKLVASIKKTSAIG